MTEKGTTAASYIAAGFSFLFGSWTVQEWVAVGGLVLGIATFAINWYYRSRMDARDSKVSRAQIDAAQRDE